MNLLKIMLKCQYLGSFISSSHFQTNSRISKMLIARGKKQGKRSLHAIPLYLMHFIILYLYLYVYVEWPNFWHLINWFGGAQYLLLLFRERYALLYFLRKLPIRNTPITTQNPINELHIENNVFMNDLMM